jgi:glycosyltransferase involved in cell wall biosynthesis
MELVKDRLQSYRGSIDFKIICHEANRGLSEARNTGINNATGDYLYFLDSDDEITCDCIETLVNLCQNQEEMAIGDFKVDGGALDIHIKIEKPLYSNKDIFNSYISRFWYEMAWNKLVRKDFILKNDLFFYPNLIQEDALWSFQVASKLKSLNFTNKETYIYHVREGSLYTTYNLKRANDMSILLNEIVETSLTLPYNVSNYIITFAMWSVDHGYYKIFSPLSQKQLFYNFVKKIKAIVNKYPMYDLNEEAKKRFAIINQPLLCNIYYKYKHYKIINIIFHRIIFKFLFK